MKLRFFMIIAVLFVNSTEGRLSSQHVERELNIRSRYDPIKNNNFKKILKKNRKTKKSLLNEHIENIKKGDSFQEELNLSKKRYTYEDFSRLLPVNRIVGGTVSIAGRYDYLAQNIGSKPCGGMLIADNIILSAAHCKGAFNQAVLGLYDYDLYSSNVRKEVISVVREIVHPDYNGDVYSDFMIVVLNKNSRFNPVCLATEKEYISPDKLLNVIGFGNTSAKGTLSNVMREAKVKYIGNTQCNNRYKNKHRSIYENMMCADSSIQRRDACDGDSGGPLIKKGNSAARDVAVGIVSWGVGCAQNPGVYARISHEINWIKAQVKKYGGKMRTDCALNSYQEKCQVKDDLTFKTKTNITCQRIRNNSRLTNQLCQHISIQSKCPISCACILQKSQQKSQGCSPRDNNSVKFHNKNNTCSNWVTKMPKQRCKNAYIKATCPVTCSCFI